MDRNSTRSRGRGSLILCTLHHPAAPDQPGSADRGAVAVSAGGAAGDPQQARGGVSGVMGCHLYLWLYYIRIARKGYLSQRGSQQSFTNALSDLASVLGGHDVGDR